LVAAVLGAARRLRPGTAAERAVGQDLDPFVSATTSTECAALERNRRRQAGFARDSRRN
jgi:hypothetical protein